MSVGRICTRTVDTADLVPGVVTVNGKRIDVQSGGSSGTVLTGEAKLTVKIPTALLVNLKAASSLGSVSLVGGFDNDYVDDRLVVLESRQGSVECEGLCTNGEIWLITNLGSGTVGFSSGDILMQIKKGSAFAVGNRGTLRLFTKMGSAKAEDNDGQIEVESNKGSVNISGQTGGTVYARAKMGSVMLSNPEALAEDAQSKRGSVMHTPGVPRTRCARLLVPEREEDPFDF